MQRTNRHWRKLMDSKTVSSDDKLGNIRSTRLTTVMLKKVLNPNHTGGSETPPSSLVCFALYLPSYSLK